MRALQSFAARELHTVLEQVQIYTPLPSTWSALMYWTGIDPANGRKIFAEKDPVKKQRQKDMAAARRRFPGAKHQKAGAKK